mgnify:CR=1 FL=1
MLERLEEIRENIFRYIEARIELFTLETRGKVEEGAVTAAHGVVLGFLATITTIFLFSLLAAWINEATDSRYVGFLVVAAFFLILTITWVVSKPSMINLIRKIAYKALKESQEKKVTDKSQAVQDLMKQTTKSMNKSDQYLK